MIFYYHINTVIVIDKINHLTLQVANMYITELGKINKSQERKKPAKASASGFSELLSSTEIEGTQSSEIPALNAKSALFFLQEEDYDAPQSKQAVN